MPAQGSGYGAQHAVYTRSKTLVFNLLCICYDTSASVAARSKTTLQLSHLIMLNCINSLTQALAHHLLICHHLSCCCSGEAQGAWCPGQQPVQDCLPAGPQGASQAPQHHAASAHAPAATAYTHQQRQNCSAEMLALSRVVLPTVLSRKGVCRVNSGQCMCSF